MSTTAPELFTTLSTGWADVVERWMDQSQQMWDQSQRMWDQLGAPLRETPEGRKPDHGPRHRHHEHHQDEHHHHEHHHDEHHHQCGRRHDCCRDACECCVPQADVVVRARVGERRVVPFRLHNAWRREREVTLAIGPWHVCSGDGLVVVAVLETEQLVLQPCEDRIVRLVLAVMAEAEDSGEHEDADAGRLEDSHRFTRDLDACASAYADLRFEGCARPQRVAVVVSPTECEAIDVACDCGCC